MSEDPNATPNQPEEARSSEQANNQPTPAHSEQYPPLPAFYEQMNVPDPYGAPATNYNAQPFTPPPNYGAPLMPPPGYGMPPAGYGAPPLMPPPGYVQPPFAERPRYDFVPPAQPLPLGQALSELPQQYLKVLKKPAARTFVEEQGKAEWGIIWMQLLFVAVLAGAGVLISVALQAHTTNTLFSSLSSLSPNNSDPGLTSTATAPLLLIASIEAPIVAVLTPFLLLAGMGIQYGLAMLFRGNGQYKQQTYNYLLFYVPVEVITIALNLLALLLAILFSNPFILFFTFLPSLAALGLGIYSIVLNVFSTMATHRLSGGKATAVVLIPYGVLFVLAFCAIFALILIAISTIH